MNDSEKTKQFLSEQKHMVISVVDGGESWAVPVKIQHREGKVLEWNSRPETRHSKAIDQNNHIALVMFRPGSEERSEFGFYATAEAEVIGAKDDGDVRYRATVLRAWINDESYIKREVSLD